MAEKTTVDLTSCYCAVPVRRPRGIQLAKAAQQFAQQQQGTDDGDNHNNNHNTKSKSSKNHNSSEQRQNQQGGLMGLAGLALGAGSQKFANSQNQGSFNQQEAFNQNQGGFLPQSTPAGYNKNQGNFTQQQPFGGQRGTFGSKNSGFNTAALNDTSGVGAATSGAAAGLENLASLASGLFSRNRGSNDTNDANNHSSNNNNNNHNNHSHNNTGPNFGQPQPDFSQPGYGQPGYGQPGFGSSPEFASQHGFEGPPAGFLGQAGFGIQPGYGNQFGNPPADFGYQFGNPVAFGGQFGFGQQTPPTVVPQQQQQYDTMSYPGGFDYGMPVMGQGFSGAMTTQGQPAFMGYSPWDQEWGGQPQYGQQNFPPDMRYGNHGGLDCGPQPVQVGVDFHPAPTTGSQSFIPHFVDGGGPVGGRGGYLPPNISQKKLSGKASADKNKPNDKIAGVPEEPMAPTPLAGWLHVPDDYNLPEGTPKGLEILAMVDGLMVHQEVETLEAIANAFGVGYEGNNQYKISNRAGVHVYQAVEDTGFCWRCCCTQLRPVHMKIFDQTGNQVLSFVRHFRLFPCAWFEPCRENVTVFHGPKDDGKVIGRVTQSCCGGCCTPKLNILSRKGDRDLIVKGPCIIGDCCGTNFNVLTDSKKKVGEVVKLSASSLEDIAKEIATDADKFTISFPQDLKVETKATSLVALLLVDLLFFEYGGNTNSNLDGTCTIDLCVLFCCGCPVPCRVTVNECHECDVGNISKLIGRGGAPVAAEMDR